MLVTLEQKLGGIVKQLVLGLANDATDADRIRYDFWVGLWMQKSIHSVLHSICFDLVGKKQYVYLGCFLLRALYLLISVVIIQ